MTTPGTPTSGPIASAPGGRAEAAAGVLKALGQSLKIVALYQPAHPVAREILESTRGAVEALCAASPSGRLLLALREGRWLVNDSPAATPRAAAKALESALGQHGLFSLLLHRELSSDELGAFCLWASAAAGPGDDPRRDLRALGITHIEPAAREDYPERSRPEAAAAPAPAPKGESFGGLLQKLVESAVDEPEERASMYAQASGLLRESLIKQVEQRTRILEEEKQRIIHEQERAGQVLEAVASGKVIVDKQGRVIMMDSVAEEISGMTLSEALGKPLPPPGPGAEDRFVALSRDLDLGEGSPPRRGVRISAEDEVSRAIRRSTALVQDESGRLVGTYSVLPAAAKFKEAQKLQEDFIARVTHDLKAPLASISASLELLRERGGAKLAPDELNFIAVGLRNSKRLSSMIQEILDFSRLRSGKLELKLESVPARRLALEAAESLRPWAESKGVALTVPPAEPPLPEVRADPRRAVEVLVNILSNALKHVPAGGRVELRAGDGGEADPGFVVFSVADDGPGIPAESLRRIFDKFVRLDDGTDASGVGLGLAIVKEIVSLHGGRAWAESAPGRGSIFRFTLPACRAAAPA